MCSKYPQHINSRTRTPYLLPPDLRVEALLADAGLHLGEDAVVVVEQPLPLEQEADRRRPLLHRRLSVRAQVANLLGRLHLNLKVALTLLRFKFGLLLATLDIIFDIARSISVPTPRYT